MPSIPARGHMARIEAPDAVAVLLDDWRGWHEPSSAAWYAASLRVLGQCWSAGATLDP